MTIQSDWKMSEESCRAVRRLVVEELARRRISRRYLADTARISLSTLEKVLSGRRPLTLPTLVKLEQALGQSLRIETTNGAERRAGGGASATESAQPQRGHGVAPDELGSYARPAVQWIEGRYLTIRPSFGDARSVYAYVTEIVWDDEAAILRFREAERTDREFTQFGQVAVPNQSGHVYLVTNRHGQHRIIVVSRPTISGEMHGVLTTLKVGRGSSLMPVSCPVALVPLKENQNAPAFGQIQPSHHSHAGYSAVLRRTTGDGFAELIGVR